MQMQNRGSAERRIYGRVRQRMLTGLVAGTQSMRYAGRESVYRADACEGVSRVALGALACLLLLVLLLLFPLPSA